MNAFSGGSVILSPCARGEEIPGTSIGPCRLAAPRRPAQTPPGHGDTGSLQVLPLVDEESLVGTGVSKNPTEHDLGTAETFTAHKPDSDGAFQPDVGGVVPEPAIERPSPFACLVRGHLRQLRPVSSAVVVCPLDEGGTEALCAFGFGDP
ncbi:hypothetical protein TM48_02206 [Mycobacterium shottsii]|nr:hypothetical protein TM48_02206 [Mycobacterium shottsii]